VSGHFTGEMPTNVERVATLILSGLLSLGVGLYAFEVRDRGLAAGDIPIAVLLFGMVVLAVWTVLETRRTMCGLPLNVASAGFKPLLGAASRPLCVWVAKATEAVERIGTSVVGSPLPNRCLRGAERCRLMPRIGDFPEQMQRPACRRTSAVTFQDRRILR
jgi:hypothetical protein